MTSPFLHRHFPQLGTTIGHVSLGTRPTPVRRLERLGLNTEVWLKDESFFGDGGWGGNPPLAALAGVAPGCANSSGSSPKRTVAAERLARDNEGLTLEPVSGVGGHTRTRWLAAGTDSVPQYARAARDALTEACCGIPVIKNADKSVDRECSLRFDYF